MHQVRNSIKKTSGAPLPWHVSYRFIYIGHGNLFIGFRVQFSLYQFFASEGYTINSMEQFNRLEALEHKKWVHTLYSTMCHRRVYGFIKG